jgi:hypothetical protein
MDWFRPADDPNRKLLTFWSQARSIGVRFDCLGFWHDQYATVIERILEEPEGKWNGPWGGEFCYSEEGALWSIGALAAPPKEFDENPLPQFAKLGNDARRERVLNLLSKCDWNYIAGAGGSLLSKNSKGFTFAPSLEIALERNGRDLNQCLKAARN